MPNRISNCLSEYKNYNYWIFLKRSYSIEIVSIIIALVVHFILDYITHWNAFTYLIIIHVGIYPSTFLIPFHYYFGWYFPQIMATLVGFYLLYKYLINSRLTIRNILLDIYKGNFSKKLIWISFILISLLFTVIKLIVLGYEGGQYAWHSFVIYFTSGLIFSFFFTPLLARLFLKNN